MAGVGREQPADRSRNVWVGSVCDARYDALSFDRVELLARAVILVAGMNIPEAAREAVLARVTGEMAAAHGRSLEASQGARGSTDGSAED